MRTSQLALFAISFWNYRLRKSLLPVNAAERQLWAIWIGYFAAYMVAAHVLRQLAAHDNWDDRTLYPFSAVLSGMGFFAMGEQLLGPLLSLRIGLLRAGGPDAVDALGGATGPGKPLERHSPPYCLACATAGVPDAGRQKLLSPARREHPSASRRVYPGGSSLGGVYPP